MGCRIARAGVRSTVSLLLLLLFGLGFENSTHAQNTATVMAGHRGEVVVKVQQFEQSRESILQALSIQGAELIDAKTLVNEKGRKHGYVTVRLASGRLPDALRVVRGTGKLSAENITTSDHTSEYEGLQRRATYLNEHQVRLASILSSERRLRGSDILYVQERLFRASVDEGQLLQQQQDIARGSRSCTLIIRLFEPMPTRILDRMQLNVAGQFASGKARALGIIDQNRARAVTAFAYALVFAPFWVPLLIVGLIALRLLYRFVALPAWYNRRAILQYAATAVRGLYALLPNRVRQPIASVRTAVVTGVPPAPTVPPAPAETTQE